MSSDDYNCGKHKERVAPHWAGKKWCNGRATVKKRAKEKMSDK